MHLTQFAMSRNGIYRIRFCNEMAEMEYGLGDVTLYARDISNEVVRLGASYFSAC